MIEPQRIGRYLSVDKFSHIQPDVAIDLIANAWKPLVEFVVRSLMKRQGVTSVYIRGLIPRGLAIENVSDVDFIYFSEVNFDTAAIDLERDTKTEFPFVKDLELFRLTRTVFGKIRHPQRRPYFHVLLKTQGLLLAGTDVTTNIAPFRNRPRLGQPRFLTRQTNFQCCRADWKRAGKEASNNLRANGFPEESFAPGV